MSELLRDVDVSNTYAAGVPFSHVSYPEDISRAYLEGDYNKIKAFEEKSAEDMEGVNTSIKELGIGAFLPLKDSTTGEEYSVCTTASNPTGWMWMRVRNATEEEEQVIKANAPADPTHAPPGKIVILQVGTFTKNANSVSLSQQPWYTDLDKDIAIAVISTLGGLLIAKVVQLILVEQAFRALAAAEADELFIAGEEALRRRAIRIVGQGPRKWIVRGVGVGAAAGLAILTVVLWPIIFKEFHLIVKVHNWHDQPWRIESWYSDNAVVAGGKNWEPVTIPKASGGFAVPLPRGFEYTQKTVGIALYNYASNSAFLHNLLEGFGIAMNVNSGVDPSKGFAFKYCIHALKDNNLGVKNGKVTDLKGYYNDDWAAGGSLKAAADGDPKITVSTDMLGGASDQNRTYRFDINIGA